MFQWRGSIKSVRTPFALSNTTSVHSVEGHVSIFSLSTHKTRFEQSFNLSELPIHQPLINTLRRLGNEVHGTKLNPSGPATLCSDLALFRPRWFVPILPSSRLSPVHVKKRAGGGNRSEANPLVLRVLELRCPTWRRSVLGHLKVAMSVSIAFCRPYLQLPFHILIVAWG